MEIDKEHFRKLPDAVCMLNLKKNLLDKYFEQNGYVRNTRSGFNVEGSEYAQAVADLGKKLGCRFYTTGNQGHFNSDFSAEPVIRELFHFMRYADFILHPDEFDVVDAKTVNTSRKYTFQRKNGKGLPITIWKDIRGEEEDCINTLKTTPDFTESMLETKENFGKQWSPAFAETYDVWMKKTMERLNRFYDEAKGFSFDESLSKVQRKMKEYDSTRGGLLTRTFARPAKSPEREEKAKGLLDVLRAKGDRKMTIREYIKRYVKSDTK